MTQSRRISQHRQQRRAMAVRARRGRQVSRAACLLAGCALVTGGWLLEQVDLRPGGATGAAAEVADATTDFAAIAEPPDWAQLLTQLSRRRSLIWQRAHPSQLRQVFAAGSSLLRRDQRSLRAYAERGIRLDGAEVVFGSIERVLVSRSSVTLMVVDRLAQVTAFHAGADARALPRDEPTRHMIVLQQTASGWRIGAVSPATKQP